MAVAHGGSADYAKAAVIGYLYRVKTVIYPHASHLLGTLPPESWKKAFPAEKKWPEECNAARKDCFEQEFQFLEEWS